MNITAASSDAVKIESVELTELQLAFDYRLQQEFRRVLEASQHHSNDFGVFCSKMEQLKGRRRIESVRGTFAAPELDHGSPQLRHRPLQA